MPGPEQRARELKAKRNSELAFLRRVHGARVEKNTRSSGPQTSANTTKVKTSTAPVVSTTGHSMASDGKGEMTFHKDSSTSTALKRKAEDNGDVTGSELGDKHEQGQKTKRIKPTCGYVPGTGNPYRGTMRETSSVPARALANKPINTMLKRRETIAKQDNRNLNRNAPKPKIPCGKGISRPTQSPPKVAEPEAMDGVVAGPLKQAFERKPEHELVNESRKKPRTGPTTLPPVRKSGVFMQSIQLPGFTAAPATNIKLVKEVVRVPAATRPQPCLEVEQEVPGPSKINAPKLTPPVEEAEASESAKKRPREDDPEMGTSKKVKIEESAARRAKPCGLHNESNACYINSVLQAIANVPRMANHYRTLADKVIPEIAEYVALNAENWSGHDATMCASKARKQVRRLLEKNKSRIHLGAYLGVLVNEMMDAESPANTPSSYIFRQACGVLLKDDQGRGYDGKEQGECMEFFEKLLQHLDMEEVEDRGGPSEAPSLVRELFGVEAVTKIKCRSCGYARDSCIETSFAFTTSMPPRKSGESTVNLTECLGAYSDPDGIELSCDKCSKSTDVLKWMELRNLSSYALVNINRVKTHDSQDTNTMTRKSDHISLPPSEVLSMRTVTEDIQYDVIGQMKHNGPGLDKGHWTSEMKIDGRWWYFSDAKVTETLPRDARSVTSMVVLKRSAQP